MVDSKLIGFGISITVLILISAGYENFTGGFEPSHYCKDRQAMAHCIVLSSTAKTCYTLENYQGAKRCSSLWKPIETSSASSPGEAPTPTQKCLRRGEFCYCSPRGLLTNKVKCEDL